MTRGVSSGRSPAASAVKLRSASLRGVDLLLLWGEGAQDLRPLQRRIGRTVRGAWHGPAGFRAPENPLPRGGRFRAVVRIQRERSVLTATQKRRWSRPSPDPPKSATLFTLTCGAIGRPLPSGEAHPNLVKAEVPGQEARPCSSPTASGTGVSDARRFLIVAGLLVWAGATLLIDAWVRHRRRPDVAERLRPFQPRVAKEAKD